MKLSTSDLRKIPHRDLRMPAAMPRWMASGVSTDSRTVTPGMVYVALRGAHFDGHEFLADAVARGASALVVHADGAAAPARYPGAGRR